MPEDGTRVWDLIKSVILPVDLHTLNSISKEIWQDAQRTSWLQLLYRLEGVSMLILIPGALILGGIFAYESGVGIAEVQTLGVQFSIGLGLLSMFILAKGVVWIVQRINQGKSIWGKDDNDIIIEFLTRLLFSLFLIIIPCYAIVEIGIPFEQIILYCILFCVVTGSLVAGLSGLLSIVVLLKVQLKKETH